MNIVIILCILLLITLLFVSYNVGVLELFNSKEVYRENSRIQDISVDVAGLKTYYLVLGENDQPTILFLHGWAGTYRQEPIRQILTAFNEYGYKVIAVEMPGMGRSQTPDLPWSNEAYSDFIVSFMDALNLETIVLVGQSFGGSVATRFTSKYPSRATDLVLVNAGATDKSTPKKWIVNIWGSVFPRIVDSTLVSKSFKQKITKFMLRLPNNDLTEQDMHERASVMSQTFVLTHSEDLLNLLPSITTRTLVVWGKSDTKIPIKEANRIVAKLPNAKLLVLDGGHTVIYDRPKAVIDIIAENLLKLKL